MTAAPASRTRPGIRLGILALAFAACESIEVSETTEIELLGAASGDGATTTFTTGLVGRLALDFAVENIGDSTATFRVRAQARTRGSAADEICDTFRASSGAPLAATVDDAPAPRLAAVRVPYDIALAPAEPGGAGRVRFLVTRDSVWTFFVDDLEASLRVRAPDGTEVPGERVDLSDDGCGDVEALWRFPLADGLWTIDVVAPTPALRMLVDESCLRRRRVPSTCPGSASELVTFAPDLTLDPGSADQGSLRASSLGIGNELVVAFECAEGPCDGALRASIHARPLACTTNDACASDQQCSRDGYCVARDSGEGGCVVAQSDRLPHSAWVLVLALLLPRRPTRPMSRPGRS